MQEDSQTFCFSPLLPFSITTRSILELGLFGSCVLKPREETTRGYRIIGARWGGIGEEQWSEVAAVSPD